MRAMLRDWAAGRTQAELACLIVGALLLARGLGGFAVADSSFATPGEGWHHTIHAVSGLLLLAAALAGGGAARPAAIAFGAFYAGLAVIGIADGDDVLGVIGADAADKSFHTVIGVVTLVAGLRSTHAGGGAAALPDAPR